MSHPAGRAFRAFAFHLSSLRLIPHLVLWRLSPSRDLVTQDVRRWAEAFLGPEGPQVPTTRAFLMLMTELIEYRNLFYFRLGGVSALLKFLCRPMESLYMHCGTLGPGLVIQHGIASVIVAERIGANCWVNQQVTIGSQGSRPGFPVLGDNVRVSVGAKVLGGITIGDNAIIGANAVVVKDVPPDVTVVGIPAYIVRRNGRRVHEPL